MICKKYAVCGRLFGHTYIHIYLTPIVESFRFCHSPMAQLTFWSLQNYDHVPSIREARKSMCKQLAGWLVTLGAAIEPLVSKRQLLLLTFSFQLDGVGLMMSQFNQHRHICENYNPHKVRAFLCLVRCSFVQVVGISHIYRRASIGLSVEMYV